MTLTLKIKDVRKKCIGVVARVWRHPGHYRIWNGQILFLHNTLRRAPVIEVLVKLPGVSIGQCSIASRPYARIAIGTAIRAAAQYVHYVCIALAW